MSRKGRARRALREELQEKALSRSSLQILQHPLNIGIGVFVRVRHSFLDKVSNFHVVAGSQGILVSRPSTDIVRVDLFHGPIVTCHRDMLIDLSSGYETSL